MDLVTKGPGRGYRTVLPWCVATLVATFLLSLPVVIEERSFGLALLVPVLTLPLAMIVTSPAILIRIAMPAEPRLWQMALGGLVFSVLICSIPDFDIVDRGTVSGWIAICAAGAAAGGVWFWAEKGAGDG